MAGRLERKLFKSDMPDEQSVKVLRCLYLTLGNPYCQGCSSQPPPETQGLGWGDPRCDMTWYLDSALEKELTCVITLWTSWLRGSRKSYHRFTWSTDCLQLLHKYCRTPPFCSTWWSHKESHLEMIEGQPHPSQGMTPPLWNLWISCFNSELENSIQMCNACPVWNMTEWQNYNRTELQFLPILLPSHFSS